MTATNGNHARAIKKINHDVLSRIYQKQLPELFFNQPEHVEQARLIHTSQNSRRPKLAINAYAHRQ